MVCVYTCRHVESSNLLKNYARNWHGIEIVARSNSSLHIINVYFMKENALFQFCELCVYLRKRMEVLKVSIE